MKKILLFLSALVLALLWNNAFADSVVHESCSTWSYAAQYPVSCNVCWYYSDSLYKWESKDYWDFFLNDTKKEQIFSSSSSWNIVPLNWSTLSSSWNIQLRANWVWSGAWINWKKEVTAFYLENLLFANNWTWSIIWRLEFNIKWAAVDNTNQSDSITVTKPSLGWNYLKWTEILLADWKFRLDWSYINGPIWDVKIYSGSSYLHKECYILKWAWCWDWARNWWESCDPNDTSKSGWGNLGCTSSCTPSNSWWGGWSCWNWVLNTWEQCDPADANKAWWWSRWCSSSCTPLSGWWGWGGWGGWGGWSCWNWVVNSWEECDLGSWNNNKWTCTTSCKLTYCWDWYLQRPNSTAKWGAKFEECDFWSTTWPSWCQKSTCKIVWDTTSPTSKCVSNCDSTTPSDKDWIIFYPAGWAILWNWMNLWDTYSLAKPYIKNNTWYDIYIEKPLCIYKQNVQALLGSTEKCTTWNIWELSPWERFELNVADYTANTSYIPSWLSYKDVNLTTAPQGLAWSYLSSILTVRVAKPTIANVYGWTSLLNFNPVLYSDVDALSQNFLNDLRNKNFVVTSIANTNGKSFSSYVSSVWNQSTYDNSINTWNKSTNSSISKVSKTWYTTAIYNLPTEKYNWLQNVFIHKWDVSLNWQTISWNKTFIIEWWNLVINGSIAAAANSNIAFIIKWWNLIIGQNVAKLDGVYLAVKQNSIGWNINSDWTSTNNRLIVNGWLYWDARDLLANRTYMKSDNWIINVWTTINFRSGVFKNPPPLLTTFIDEYMKVNKIAK